jgi:beta-phosphoglucomutase-like phosphatase (HAD superfamily)
VAKLLTDARKAEFALAIATTTSFENVRTLVEVTLGGALDDLFDLVAAGDMVPAKKPAPDVYLLALAKLDVSPMQAIAFEDSAIGLAAANAAGIATIVTPSRYTVGDDFSGALVCLPDLATPLADGRHIDIAMLDGLVTASRAQAPHSVAMAAKSHERARAAR